MIKIDINEYVAKSTWSNTSTVSNFIIKEIMRIRNEFLLKNIKFTNIIVGTILFNSIADSSSFTISTNALNHYDSPDETVKFGVIGDLNVYININMNRDIIKMTVDKDVHRDSIIDSILYDKEVVNESTIEIKVISDFI